MLVGQFILDSLDQGTYVPMTNNIVVRRDSKSETLGSGILFSPENQIVSPNWCTILAVPKYVKSRGREIPCPYKVGDRVFVRPMDGEKLIDTKKEIQNVLYPRIEAYEIDGVIFPAEYRVLVKITQQKMETKGGLLLPDNIHKFTGKKNDTGEGTVVWVSEKIINTDIQVGDYVYYVADSGARLEIDKEDYTILGEDDLLLRRVDE